jgi:hypothetical protein
VYGYAPGGARLAYTDGPSVSLRAWCDRLLGRSPAKEHRSVFDTPPRRTLEEQAVIDEKLRKLLGDERQKSP